MYLRAIIYTRYMKTPAVVCDNIKLPLKLYTV